jgi:hypothetical protein
LCLVRTTCNSHNSFCLTWWPASCNSWSFLCRCGCLLPL